MQDEISKYVNPTGQNLYSSLTVSVFKLWWQ